MVPGSARALGLQGAGGVRRRAGATNAGIAARFGREGERCRGRLRSYGHMGRGRNREGALLVERGPLLLRGGDGIRVASAVPRERYGALGATRRTDHWAPGGGRAAGRI